MRWAPRITRHAAVTAGMPSDLLESSGRIVDYDVSNVAEKLEARAPRATAKRDGTAGFQ